MSFLDKNFLLHTKTARYLYHEFAKDLPIIDYHNHLSAYEIATNKKFENMSEIWLYGDHYKWRAMRANGIPEAYITGNKSDKEKFKAWAKTVPYTMRNPLYHWTHLELQRYFGINELLSEKTSDKIYKTTTALLHKDEFSTVSLLAKMNVEIICTTDDPSDDLNQHQQFKKSNHTLKMLPTFRPDNAILIENSTFLSYLKKLEKSAQTSIRSFKDLVKTLEDRIEYFHKRGCRLADHGLNYIPKENFTDKKIQNIFSKRLKNKKLSKKEVDTYKVGLLIALAKMYHHKNWTMQLHLGAIRNNNNRLTIQLGNDVGCDSIGDYQQATGLSYFLNALDFDNKLPKTILYNLNPKDNEVFATMAGNFTSDGGVNNVQYGAAWWFLDQKNGIEKQLNTLSNMGLLSRSVGMLTDSRSFLSFTRHEYFRRILCNLLGKDIENGELPNDSALIGKMVQDICYYNAKKYFQFD